MVDWSNDAEKWALHHWNKLHFEIYLYRKRLILNCNNISPITAFVCNAFLNKIPKTLKNLTDPTMLNGCVFWNEQLQKQFQLKNKVLFFNFRAICARVSLVYLASTLVFTYLFKGKGEQTNGIIPHSHQKPANSHRQQMAY